HGRYQPYGYGPDGGGAVATWPLIASPCETPALYASAPITAAIASPARTTAHLCTLPCPFMMHLLPIQECALRLWRDCEDRFSKISLRTRQDLVVAINECIEDVRAIRPLHQMMASAAVHHDAASGLWHRGGAQSDHLAVSRCRSIEIEREPARMVNETERCARDVDDLSNSMRLARDQHLPVNGRIATDDEVQRFPEGRSLGADDLDQSDA